ncbi:Hypothetical predicted protein [Pelobates cultripes]|uniref:Uncharacterized protein n=1 Tax=Pelobates cultripes TaxID=61616 RepID=A0AAD1SGZ6_PELCU|nr:Hypothetical predicted protein [Pelobates cultripes]
MDEIATAHNSVTDQMLKMEEWLAAYEAKLTPLEDRFIRHNLCLCGIPESTAVSDLTSYAMGLFRTLCPDMPADMILLDRVQQVVKARAAPQTTLWDVLLRVHYHHIKEAILRASRTAKELSGVYAQIQIFAEISPTTLAQ